MGAIGRIGERMTEQTIPTTIRRDDGVWAKIPTPPPADTKEEITGPLVAYLRHKDPTVVRAFVLHYAKDRSGAWMHNPWLLWFAGPLPAKMPWWWIQHFYPEAPLVWDVVPPEQGELF
jgi:hypothetical protein